MKRTVILTRHAKSDWAGEVMTDFDRPLNSRGMRDAPLMGQRLLTKGYIPDLIISSTAKRAGTTARLIAGATGYEEAKIKWVGELYHCRPKVFEEVISGTDDAAKIIMVVAHNPGITEYANEKVTGLAIDNMPTCSIVAFSVLIDSWEQFPGTPGAFEFFDYPKKNK